MRLIPYLGMCFTRSEVKYCYRLDFNLHIIRQVLFNKYIPNLWVVETPVSFENGPRVQELFIMIGILIRLAISMMITFMMMLSS